jgi:transcriptional regulator with XRE-family HTH domain
LEIRQFPQLGIYSYGKIASMEGIRWHVGDVVRKLRGRRSATKLAKGAKVNKDVWRKVEADSGNYEFESLNKVAAALGTDVATLNALIPVQRTYAPPEERDRFETLYEAVRLAYETDPLAKQFLDAVWERYAAPATSASAQETARRPEPPPGPRPTTPGTHAAGPPGARRRQTAADAGGAKAPARDE